MEGEKHQKCKGKQPGKAEKGEKIVSGGAMAKEQGESNGGQRYMDMETNIAAIRADIKTMVMEMKSELGNFRDRIGDDLKKELADIRDEIQQKLSEVTTDLYTAAGRVDEAEGRIATMEEWTVDFKEALSQSLQAQESLQVKLTELEARSR